MCDTLSNEHIELPCKLYPDDTVLVQYYRQDSTVYMSVYWADIDKRQSVVLEIDHVKALRDYLNKALDTHENQ